MATVVDLARPAATTTPDLSVKFGQSVADGAIQTLRHFATAPAPTLPATDDLGTSGGTEIDWTKAGTDLDRG